MRIEQLTFTRFIAAISIVVFHYGIHIFPFNMDVVNFLFRKANIGVSYFFVLSGFIMVIVYGNKEKIKFTEYLSRRFSRIYPVYALALVTSLSYLLVVRVPIDYNGLLLNVLMIQSWVPGYALSINGPGWSLSIELFFYISFPFLCNNLYSKYAFKKLIFPVFLFFIGSQVLHHALLYSDFYKGFPSKSHDLVYYYPLMHFSEFLIGNLGGLFFLKGVKSKNYDLHIIGIILLMTIILKLNFAISYHNGLLAFVFVPLILLISANNGILTKFFTVKILVFLGEISYGVYIFQKPIFTWVKKIMKYLDFNDETQIFYISLLVLIIVSGLSFKYFETPIRKLINDKFNNIKMKRNYNVDK